jgi:DNA modification methylase
MEEAVYEEGMRAKRSVWTQAGDSAPQSEHFATYPQKLIEPCVIAGSPKGGVVLDPFAGLGTTGIVAENLGRDSIMIELSKEYIREMKKRIKKLT